MFCVPLVFSLSALAPLRAEDWVFGSLHLLLPESAGWDQMVPWRGNELLLTVAHTCSGLSTRRLTIQLDSRHRKQTRLSAASGEQG